ncbi:MAG: transporter [Deltaproteobacteria bacterium]|nr:transporter [Deltaproteobacteria bacterium]
MTHRLFSAMAVAGTLLLAQLAVAQVAVPSLNEPGSPTQWTAPAVGRVPSPHGGYATDSEEIAAERPRATRRLAPVGSRHFQMETSVDYQTENDTAAKREQISFPTLLRYGLSEHVEVQMQGNMYTFQNISGGSNVNGFGDLFFGSKWAALDGGGLLPSLGFAGRLGLPTGSNSVSGNALQPQAETIMSWDMPWEMTLDGNLGMDLPPKDAAGDRFVRLTYGAAVERPLPFWSDRLNAFVEFAGAVPLKSQKSGTHLFGTGVGFRIRDNMQLDTFGRFGLSKSSPDVQTGLGFSWRL